MYGGVSAYTPPSPGFHTPRQRSFMEITATEVSLLWVHHRLPAWTESNIIGLAPPPPGSIHSLLQSTVMSLLLKK